MVTHHMRTRESQSSHDQEVRARYNQFRRDSRWTDVRADLPDTPKPGTFGGHIPDVTGWWERKTFCLLEVETADSYASEHAKSQYRAFDRAGTLILDVPSRVEEAAKVLLESMGIEGLVWTY